MKEENNYQIHFLSNPKDIIQSHEISAAGLLAKYFRSDVYFLSREVLKTPDLRIKDQYWELKSPISNGKKTIENCLRAAAEQSQNVVLDLRRFPADYRIAINKTRYFLKCTPNKIKRIIFITKSNEILDKF
ncbi:MAG: hypothetical protein Q4B29_01950 [Candidatus Saccharibacteria bacterium]|nr:hypothetical protein [Candidatus Saccharibacteria bacterium]